MNVWIFLADGFELVEALCPLDVLRRAGANAVTVSVNDTVSVTSSNRVTVRADRTLAEIAGAALPDRIVLPGGMPGASNLRACPTVCDAVRRLAEAGCFVAAICAAPFILGELGLLDGRSATCFPGFESRLTGAILSDKKVVRDGPFITAAGMGASLSFSAALVTALFGKEKADAVLASIQTP